MKFTQPSFTVPTGHRPADSCSHGWLDVRGRCVFCGANPSDRDDGANVACHRCGRNQTFCNICLCGMREAAEAEKQRATSDLVTRRMQHMSSLHMGDRVTVARILAHDGFLNAEQVERIKQDVDRDPESFAAVVTRTGERRGVIYDPHGLMPDE